MAKKPNGKYLWIFLLAMSAPLYAQAQVRVPRSTSPDGKVALYYRSTPASAPAKYFEFYFRATKTKEPLSAQLVPDTTGGVLGMDTAADDAWDSKMLFEQIAWSDEKRRIGGKVDSAAWSFVEWSPDSRWVSIEGGAHKFWQVTVYHLAEGRYAHVELPRWHAFDAFFRESLPHPRIKRLGASSKLASSDNGNYTANVCWLENGLLAANADPYLINQDAYLNMRREFYYMLDCRPKDGVAITGFCR